MESVSPGTYKLLFADGSSRLETKTPRMAELRSILEAEGLDVVNLRNGCVLLVDDTGFNEGKPVNEAATKLYHEVCRPGTTHPICGDAAIVRDSDFA